MINVKVLIDWQSSKLTHMVSFLVRSPLVFETPSLNFTNLIFAEAPPIQIPVLNDFNTLQEGFSRLRRLLQLSCDATVKAKLTLDLTGMNKTHILILGKPIYPKMPNSNFCPLWFCPLIQTQNKG